MGFLRVCEAIPPRGPAPVAKTVQQPRMPPSADPRGWPSPKRASEASQTRSLETLAKSTKSVKCVPREGLSSGSHNDCACA